jgi:hypothetical protein
MSNLFEAGNNEQVCQWILWDVLHSQDVMVHSTQNGFKDDPTVSAKLMKSMAVNTGFEALELMVAKVKVMEYDLATPRKRALRPARLHPLWQTSRSSSRR